MDRGGVTHLETYKGPVRTLDGQRVVFALGSVLALIAVAAVFDIYLVRQVNAYKSQIGTRLFEKALVVKQQGKTHEALQLFRSALTESPANAEYQLAFSKALADAGRLNESRASLERLLSRYPAYGPANAELARILAREGDWQNAAWYYHRALYGEWPGSPDLRSLRFELADLLARHNAREQLASEVVLLESRPGDPAQEAHLARLQLAAGQWNRADSLYRTLLQSKPDDPELLAGLGRAEFGTGKYLAAERTLRRALDAGLRDPEASREFAVATEVNDLDPTLRRLSPKERHRRAHELVLNLLSALRACSTRTKFLNDWQRVVETHKGQNRPLALAEADVDIFERLWLDRDRICSKDLEMPESIRLLAAELAK
jgi:predicted Zn-dependent protease